MRYFYRDGCYLPKHNLYGPRPNQALVLNHGEWFKINDHLHREQREFAAVEVNMSKQEDKKQRSLKMTSTWDNTLVSIKQTGEKKRREKVEKEAQKRLDEYNEVMKKRKEEHDAIIEEARRRIYQERDTTKTLVGALRMSAVLHERQKQVEFNSKQRNRASSINAEYAAKVLREAKEFQAEKQQEKMKDREKKLNFRRVINEQIQEKQAYAEEAEKTELEHEKIDLKRMKEEIEKINAQGKEERMKARQDLVEEIRNEKTGANTIRQQRAREEDEEEQIRQIYRDVGCEIAERRKIVERDAIQGVLARRQKQSEKIAAMIMGTARIQAEEVSMSRAQKEKEEEETRKKDEVKAKKARLLKELLETMDESKRREEEETMKRNETIKWEMLQRLRRDEVNKAWRETTRQLEREATRRVREDLKQQMEEKKERAQKEREEDLQFGRVSFEKTDKALLDYCDFTLNFARNRGLPEIPVLQAIERVKQETFLRPVEKEVRFLQSKVPIDSVRVYSKCAK